MWQKDARRVFYDFGVVVRQSRSAAAQTTCAASNTHRASWGRALCDPQPRSAPAYVSQTTQKGQWRLGSAATRWADECTSAGIYGNARAANWEGAAPPRAST